MDEKFMDEAIRLSSEGMENDKGGPFGAVVIKDGKIVGKGYNCVTSSYDPTLHAEIVAIRDACKNLDTFELTGCEIYTSCEPCPMCLGAIYWARLDKVYYANTRENAAEIGFDDAFIYEEIGKQLDERKISFLHMANVKASQVFRQWKEKTDRIHY